MSCFRTGIASRKPPHDEDVGHSTGKTRWMKIAWSSARLLFSGTNPMSKSRTGGEEVDGHKEWLLGDGHVVVHGEVESMCSSFRLSFESHLESEETGGADNSSTLLMTPDGSRENQRLIMLKCRRLQSLERTISPVVIIAGLVRFQYQDILVATRNFEEERVLGRGALSCVYKASMRRRRGRRSKGKKSTVAIKKIHGSGKESFKTFSRELMIAGSLKNPNINVVPILGFCIDREGLFLVYKYIAGGSLDLRLHPGPGPGPGDDDQLSWSVRFKVALGTARAVEYLHTGSDRCVIHRDIKPSNILLSSKNHPKLCDFGLATWIQRPSMPFQCKNVRGTFGYLAPEYFQHGELSDKTDVYAFGVVLLELITGRKPIDIDKPCGEQNLVSWAKRMAEKMCGAQSEEEEDLVDQRLKRSFYNRNEMRRTIRTAFACLKCEQSERPTISDVINMLCGEKLKKKRAFFI